MVSFLSREKKEPLGGELKERSFGYAQDDEHGEAGLKKKL